MGLSSPFQAMNTRSKVSDWGSRGRAAVSVYASFWKELRF